MKNDLDWEARTCGFNTTVSQSGQESAPWIVGPLQLLLHRSGNVRSF
jgi:hypothetical protein